MCGIFGMVSQQKKPVNQQILAGLKTLQYRGYDSWGVAVVADSGITVVKDIGKIDEQLSFAPIQARSGIGHTRWATHGGVTKQNAHPHVSYDGRFTLVHNGIIENYVELKQQILRELPELTFKSETDSEVFVHMLALSAQKNEVKDAFFYCLMAITGFNAIVVLDQQTQTLMAYRHGSPLVYAHTADAEYLASDVVAVLPYTNLTYFFGDQEVFFNGALFDLRTGQPKQIKFETVSIQSDELNKDGFAYYMEKEIHEAPAIIGRLLATYAEQSKPFRKLLKNYEQVALIGCGSAYYASLIGQYLFSKAGIHAEAYSGGEAGHFMPTLSSNTLPIFLSQSGETMDLLEQVSYLKNNGRELAAMVNRVSSSLDREATASFHLLAGPEISVVSTKAFLAKLISLLLLTGDLAGDLEKVQQDLSKATTCVANIVEPENINKISQFASRLSKEKSVFVLGRGLQYPLALECALKAKEAAYLHAEGFAGGELKHGVIALIEPGSWVIALLGGDEEDQNMISNVNEVKARGAKVLGISPKSNPLFDAWFGYDHCGQANILLETVLIQLLGLELAKSKGLDPDKPRNLAKSVTVK